MSIVDRTDLDAFTRLFLDAYLHGGFGTLPKREIDLLVFRLLLECRKDKATDGGHHQIDAFVWARDLCTTRTRIRSMLDELSYRQPLSDDLAKVQLRSILSTQTPGGDASEVRIQIENAFLREYARRIVQTDLGIVDTSFDRTMMVLSGPKYLSLVVAVAGEGARKKFENMLRKSKPENLSVGREGLVRSFLRKMVEGAAAETGRWAVRAGALLLSHPEPTLQSLMDGVRGVWNRMTADRAVGVSRHAQTD
jgi:hypothetical protein